ncbi:Rieske 2Fe-2S domain-containing protein [Streptomyces sp. NPDC048659]|uniref:Rieske 2Fe-2S domain-containing protein n=1 Tax=Streptomyces sp. NPDC048659 TaxID=3155489 RepID=UPI003445E78D
MSADVRWTRAAADEDLWEGDLLGVEVAGRPVLLVRLAGGAVRAYQGQCPHQGLPLAEGDFDVDTGVLTCSGHLWEFDAATGGGINPSTCLLTAYTVRVREGSVDIAVPTQSDGQKGTG